MADDCMGLAQQVAFSSLLAFLPTVILLIGLLGLFGTSAFDEVERFVGTVAPNGVTDMIQLAKEDAAQNKERLGDRLRGRHTHRALGSERRDGRGHEGRQPRLRPHRDPSVLETAGDRDRARRRHRARDGRHVPADRVRRQPGRRARLAHGPRRQLQAVLEHCPLADRVRRGAALLLARLLPRAGHGVPQLALGHAGHAGRVGALARAFGPVRALHELRELVRQDVRLDRGRDHPAAVAQLQRVGDPLRRGAERGARPAGGHPRGGRAQGGARQAGAARAPR